MQRFFSILADGGRALRGDRRQVHRRRDHGRLRGPDRPRGPRSARLLRRPADARRRRRATRPSCAASEGLNFSVRIGINSGEVVAGAIGAGGRGRLHGDRPHGRPRPADGGARRARQGLPDRAHRGARRAASSSSRTWASSRSRAPASRFEVFELSRGRRGALAARPLPRARLLPLRRPRAGDGGASRRRSRGPRRGEGAVVGDRRRGRRRQEPALPRVRRALPRARASRSSKRRRSRTASRSRSCRSCRCCAPTSASATANPTGSLARRSPAGPCCSTPSFADGPAARSSTSSASPTPTGRLRR